MHYRRLTQEQVDAFTLDMNSAYARLKGIEEAIDSECCSAVSICACFCSATFAECVVVNMIE